MSAPDTNIEKQKKRHKPVIVGLALVAAFAAVVFLSNLRASVDEDAALVADDAQMIEGQ